MLILDGTFSTSTAALEKTAQRAFAKNAMTSLTIAKCAKMTFARTASRLCTSTSKLSAPKVTPMGFSPFPFALSFRLPRRQIIKLVVASLPLHFFIFFFQQHFCSAAQSRA